MENHLGENGDDCKKCISGSKVFQKIAYTDNFLTIYTYVKKLDLSRKLYLKSLPKQKGTQKHT